MKIVPLGRVKHTTLVRFDCSFFVFLALISIVPLGYFAFRCSMRTESPTCINLRQRVDNTLAAAALRQIRDQIDVT
jgi:hypothetical protein